MKTYNPSDGSAHQPRLLIYGNEWGLSELPRRPAEVTWSFGEVLEKIKAAGFDGMQADFKQAPLVHRSKLRFAASARANSPHDIEELVHKASDCGADCLTLHAGWGTETDAEMAEYAVAVLEASNTQRLPVLLETHRATILQDVYRTCRLLEAFPDLRLNGDLSHYYCGHEMTYRGFEHSRADLLPILKRIAFIHGRVASGEQIQIDVGNGKSNPHARNFAWMWKSAMTFWLKQALPGDILPFAPELGPPSSGYSLTHTDDAVQTVELSDRWAQTLVMADMAREAFAQASGSPVSAAVG